MPSEYMLRKRISVLTNSRQTFKRFKKSSFQSFFFLKFPFLVVFFHPHFCTSKNHFNQTDQFASLQKERQEDRSFKIGIGREKVKNSGKLKSYLHIFHHHDIIVAISKREMSVNLIVWRFPLTCQI